MSKIKITTPENIEIEYTLADLGSRTAAAVIDFLIISGILLVMIVIPLIIVYNTTQIQLFDEYYGWVLGISLIVSALIYYGYFIILEMTMNGMTPGKKVLGIRTIRNNGQPVSIKHSAIRNLFKILIDISGVGAVLIYINKERKRIGDMLASTIVVMEEEAWIPESPTGFMAGNPAYDLLNSDEIQLLEDYFDRRDSINDGSRELGSKVFQYFSQKSAPDERIEDYKRFLGEIQRTLTHE